MRMLIINPVNDLTIRQLYYLTYLMFEEVLCVPICECDEPGGDEGDDAEERRRGDRVHRVDAPEQPDRDRRHDERVSVEQRGRLKNGDTMDPGLGKFLLKWNSFHFNLVELFKL